MKDQLKSRKFQRGLCVVFFSLCYAAAGFGAELPLFHSIQGSGGSSGCSWKPGYPLVIKDTKPPICVGEAVCDDDIQLLCCKANENGSCPSADKCLADPNCTPTKPPGGTGQSQD